MVGLRGQGSRRSRSSDWDLFTSTCDSVRNCSRDSHAGCRSDAYKVERPRDQIIASLNNSVTLCLSDSQLIALTEKDAKRAIKIARKAMAGNF